MAQLGGCPDTPRARFARFIANLAQPGKEPSESGLLHLLSLSCKDALVLFEALQQQKCGGSVEQAQLKYHSILAQLWPLDRRLPDNPVVVWRRLASNICISGYKVDRKTRVRSERVSYLAKQLTFKAERKPTAPPKVEVATATIDSLNALEQLILPPHEGFCGAFAIRLFRDTATGSRPPSTLTRLYPALLLSIIEYVPIFAGQVLCSTRRATNVNTLDVKSLLRIIGHPLCTRHSLSWLKIRLPFELSYEDALALYDRVVSGGGSVPEWKQLLVALDSSSSRAWRRTSRVRLDALIAMHKMCRDHETEQNANPTTIPSSSTASSSSSTNSTSHVSASDV